MTPDDSFSVIRFGQTVEQNKTALFKEKEIHPHDQSYAERFSPILFPSLVDDQFTLCFLDYEQCLSGERRAATREKKENARSLLLPRFPKF